MNQNQTSTNEAQIRELVESWATAVRNKDMESEWRVDYCARTPFRAS